MRLGVLWSVLLIIPWVAPDMASGGSTERQIVAESGQVLQEIMAIPAKGIPRSLLSEAQGLVVVPGMIRGGFVIGIKHGRGIAVARDNSGAWSKPIFMRMSGGNVGLQAGLQSTDLILVFRNRARVAEMLQGRFTLGANAGVAAGPIGRSTTAATDGQLRAEILSYSRSRGLFAGISIDGAVLQPEPQMTAAFYGRTPARPDGQVPDAAVRFLSILHALSGAPDGPDAAAPVVNHEKVCRQLMAAHHRLLEILDPAWQQHLALPTEITSATPQGQQSVREALARFNRIAEDPQFRALAEQQEFQETLTLLNRHAWLQEAAASHVLPLPPPPR